MKEITLEELLEAGCHFGHQVTRHNPKSRDFVFEARDNIHIIDLTKTKEGLDDAAAYVKSVAAKGGSLIVVGTKRQARDIVAEEVKRARGELAGLSPQEGADGIFMVTNRWIGGILTNFTEVAKNYRKLKDLAAKLKDDEEKAKYTKKEVGLWEKDRQKLESFYSGIAAMTKIPTALFIIDTHLESLAVQEAREMGVKTIGIVDTNADPFIIDYPIPANDDAVGSIKLIATHIIDAWIEGKKGAAEQQADQRAEAVKEEAKKEVDSQKEKVDVAKPQVEEVKEKKAAKSKVKSQKSKSEVKSKKLKELETSSK